MWKNRRQSYNAIRSCVELVGGAGQPLVLCLPALWPVSYASYCRYGGAWPVYPLVDHGPKDRLAGCAGDGAEAAHTAAALRQILFATLLPVESGRLAVQSIALRPEQAAARSSSSQQQMSGRPALVRCKWDPRGSYWAGKVRPGWMGLRKGSPLAAVEIGDFSKQLESVSTDKAVVLNGVVVSTWEGSLSCTMHLSCE